MVKEGTEALTRGDIKRLNANKEGMSKKKNEKPAMLTLQKSSGRTIRSVQRSALR